MADILNATTLMWVKNVLNYQGGSSLEEFFTYAIIIVDCICHYHCDYVSAIIWTSFNIFAIRSILYEEKRLKSKYLETTLIKSSLCFCFRPLCEGMNFCFIVNLLSFCIAVGFGWLFGENLGNRSVDAFWLRRGTLLRPLLWLLTMKILSLPQAVVIKL